MFISKFFKSLQFYILTLLFSQQVFAYTFYVQTSEFNDDVYIIGNVVTQTNQMQSQQILGFDNKNQISDNKVFSNKNSFNQSEREWQNIKIAQNQCTNLKSKPLLHLSENFKQDIKTKGLNLNSLEQAENFWNNFEERDPLNNCRKLDEKNLFETAKYLNKLILDTDYHHNGKTNSYPKIYNFQYINSASFENVSKKSKEKYLNDLFQEISSLRLKLLEISKNEIIIDHYFMYINEKSFTDKLNTNEKQFVQDYGRYRVNSKIDKLGLPKKFYFQNKTNKKINSLIINEKLYEDISPMIDLYLLSSKHKKNTYKGDIKVVNRSFILNKFSDIMNNL